MLIITSYRFLLFYTTSILSILSILSFVNGNTQEFCSRTPDCLSKVRKLTAQNNRFWFGDNWRLACGGFSTARLREQNPIKCLNPRELAGFYSLGSRLFHARTFTSAYLRSLSIYPRMTFSLQLGEYRACDHDFQIQCNSTQIDGHPDMEPLDPFLSRLPPDITWPEMQTSDSNIILLIDAGFGSLKYMVADFPRGPRLIQPYTTIDNFRQGQPTPLVLLVFRASPISLNSVLAAQVNTEKVFDLTAFMMEHQLEDDLIGINWAMIGSDGYAMERQRLKGSVDNCHSLIQKKLQQDKIFEFAENFPLYEMDSSLSVSYTQPRARFEVCCRYLDESSKEIFVDSLANIEIPTSAVRNLPTITSLRSIEYETDYQRSLRHYVAMKEDKYTLVVFDPDRGYLYWLLADIPSGALAAGTLITESNQITQYLPPVPIESDPCINVVIMLFRQSGPQHTSEISRFYNKEHGLKSKHCFGHCIHRSGFDISQFKSFHRLKLSAVSWFRVCYDLHEAYRRIKQLKNANDSLLEPMPYSKSTWHHSKQRTKNEKLKAERRTDLIQTQRHSLKQQKQMVCAAVQQEDLRTCDPEPSFAIQLFTFPFTIGICIFLSLFIEICYISI